MRIGRQSKGRGGFTLVEIMAVVVISSMLVLAAYTTIMSLARGSKSMVNFSEMNTQTRWGIEIFGRDVRMGSAVRWEDFGPTGVVIRRATVVDASGTVDMQDFAYLYDADAKTFRREVWAPEYDPENHPEYRVDGSSRVLLTDVEELKLHYYTARQESTSNPADVKHIQLEAKLERTVINLKNTNYIISARFMMRNKNVSR